MTLPFDIPSGLPALWADAKAFLAAVRLARPELLWLSLLPAVVTLVGWLVGRFSKTGLHTLGRPAAVAGLLTGPKRRRARLSLLVAWSALAIGAAGPAWGPGDDDGVAVGRDVVIVLDVSRSMLADDTARPPTRWQTAVEGAVNLIDELAKRGGHRAAVVIFAGRPHSLVPLTTDYDHLRTALRSLDVTHPPPEVRPAPGTTSGTRIGAALAAAVTAHDARFPGSQDVVLISDGDDPADDREWATGVTAARTANVPVHVVGVGDPTNETALMSAGRPVEGVGKSGLPEPATTRLHEEVLTAIAAGGRGQYLAARREVPRLGELWRTRIEPTPSRELADDAVPQVRDRSAWFLAVALALFTLSWGRER